MSNCELRVKIQKKLQIVVDIYTNRNYTIGVLKGNYIFFFHPLYFYFIFSEVLKMATIKKSNKKKKIIIAVCVVLVIAILGTVIGVAAGSSQKTAVTLTTIGTGEINETVSATGVVSSGTSKEYKVGAVATVKEVFVQTGDQVKKGDMLATFDTSSLDSQKESLNNSYNQARQSYLQSVDDQKVAKENLDNVNKEIADLEAQVENLGVDVENEEFSIPDLTVEDTEPQTEQETEPETETEPITEPETENTQPTSETVTSATTEAVTYPATVEGAITALTDLISTINSLSNDIQQTNEITRVVMEEIASALQSGNYAPDKIAQQVGDAVSQAIQEGIIDETKLIVESGVAVDMIEAAVSGINWSAIGEAFASSPNVELTTLELRLTALYAQREIYSLESSDDTVYAKKQVMDTAKSALDAVTDASDELEAGWTAAFDGTITECNIYPGEQTSMLSSGITLENLDSMVVTLSLGEYDVHKVKVGMSATITSAYGTYTGEVLSKAPTATGGSDSSILDSLGSSVAGISGLSSLTSTGAGVEVLVSVNNPDDNIIAGFDADVEIEVGDYKNIVTVPIESIVLEKTGTYVYLYNAEDETVTKTLIETGAVSDSAYQVTSGLQVGDQIVSTPSSDYEEDTFEVRVTE